MAFLLQPFSSFSSAFVATAQLSFFLFLRALAKSTNGEPTQRRRPDVRATAVHDDSFRFGEISLERESGSRLSRFVLSLFVWFRAVPNSLLSLYICLLFVIGRNLEGPHLQLPHILARERRGEERRRRRRRSEVRWRPT